MMTINEMKKMTGIHFTMNHTGKMAGMISLSTSNLVNPFCIAHRKCEGSICQKCYACAQMKRYTSMQECLSNNFDILTSRILKDEEMPMINAVFFRLEAFGDVWNVNQVANYFKIAAFNPNVNFSLWTKNPQIIAAAIKAGFEKPSNLNIILSSLYINKVANADKYDFVDKVFTVYDKKTIERENININCGARNCFTCQKCYKKDTERFINEKLK